MKKDPFSIRWNVRILPAALLVPGRKPACSTPPNVACLGAGSVRGMLPGRTSCLFGAPGRVTAERCCWAARRCRRHGILSSGHHGHGLRRSIGGGSDRTLDEIQSQPVAIPRWFARRIDSVLSGHNLGVWLGGWYPMTGAGLLTCYTNAIPFFGYTISGDLVFTAILFGSWSCRGDRSRSVRTSPALVRIG